MNAPLPQWRAVEAAAEALASAVDQLPAYPGYATPLYRICDSLVSHTDKLDVLEAVDSTQDVLEAAEAFARAWCIWQGARA